MRRQLIQKSKKLNFKKRMYKILNDDGKIPGFVRFFTKNKVQSVKPKRNWRRQKMKC